MQAAASRVPHAASPMVVVPHREAAAAFTGRSFGNVSYLVGSGEPEQARRALAPAIGAAPDRIVFAEQVHSAAVAVVGGDAAGAGLTDHRGAIPGVDALVTSEPGLALAVLTADCIPVLLAGPGVVAAAHAGRAGLMSGVLEATVAAIAGLGVAAADLTVLLGPAIDGCCYEVEEELAQAFGAGTTTTWGSPSIDLRATAASTLHALGVGRVGRVGGCTRCSTDTWFSHRAVTDGRQPAGPHGRQAAVIARCVPPSTHDLHVSPEWLS